MNKTQNPQSESARSEKSQTIQNDLVQAFFKTDGIGEVVESMHVMVESFLFSKDLENVTPEMRVHIVNHLRAATLISQLGETTIKGRRNGIA